MFDVRSKSITVHLIFFLPDMDLEVDAVVTENIQCLLSALSSLDVFMDTLTKTEKIVCDMKMDLNESKADIVSSIYQHNIQLIEKMAASYDKVRKVAKTASAKVLNVLYFVNHPDSLEKLAMTAIVKHSLPSQDLPNILASKLEKWPEQKSRCNLMKLLESMTMKEEIYDLLETIDDQFNSFNAHVNQYVCDKE